jgi:hypothetical protein
MQVSSLGSVPTQKTSGEVKKTGDDELAELTEMAGDPGDDGMIVNSDIEPKSATEWRQDYSASKRRESTTGAIATPN